MTWEPRPLPTVNPETERFWAAATDERLLLRQCQACGLTHYYPRRRCPDCFAPEVEWVEADGTGTVYSYSIQATILGWPDAALPLVVAYVELDEGPRMLTNIVESDPDRVAIGTRVAVRFEPTSDDDIAVPVFEVMTNST